MPGARLGGELDENFSNSPNGDAYQTMSKKLTDRD